MHFVKGKKVGDKLIWIQKVQKICKRKLKNLQKGILCVVRTKIRMNFTQLMNFNIKGNMVQNLNMFSLLREQHFWGRKYWAAKFPYLLSNLLEPSVFPAEIFYCHFIK